jgi:NAD(P)-dependent dehydrogenase (short-subunit alcohol dehydrogenase family)
LGLATAIALARRGARVIMAVRSGIPDQGERVRQASGSPAVEMRHVDLSDLDSIRTLVDGLCNDGVQIDRLVSNAATVPAHARKTRQGLEEMFVVNYLSAFYLANLLRERGVLAPHARVVFVASESHRSSPPIDWAAFGAYADYGMKQVVPLYGYYKHMLLSFAWELGRRAHPGLAVHALCPGPVNSRIAREAPWFLRWLVAGIFALCFKDPAQACEPVVYLACARALEGRSGVYLHRMEEKSVAAATADADHGRKLWDASRALLERLGHGG